MIISIKETIGDTLMEKWWVIPKFTDQLDFFYPYEWDIGKIPTLMCYTGHCYIKDYDYKFDREYVHSYFLTYEFMAQNITLVEGEALNFFTKELALQLLNKKV